ncbi:MAG: hypothetical protein EPO21_10410 [Chloroflexota bacterium]|nr:MAG: hypothetical protein EPO21_10410 [Chloroflexota bacterium]
MQIVPTSLVRISRYYMVTAIGYLILTLLIGVLRALSSIPDPRVHWEPALLGWVSFPIFGAYYQFFPTLQGRDLKWERATLPQFALVNVGLLGMFATAWIGSQSGLALTTAIYGLGVILFALVIVANIQRSKLSLTLTYYTTSLAYFVVAVVLFAAQTLGASLPWVSRPFIFHAIALGWVILAIVGAELSLVPMLQLKELRHPVLAKLQYVLLNLGIIGMIYSFGVVNFQLVAIWGSLVLLALLLFTYIILVSLFTGPSRLKKLDISVKYFLVGIAYLLAAVVTGILMAAFGWYQLLPIHVHLALIGLVTNTIVGAMYHIVPFVVWWEVYAPRLGLHDVPLLKQLFNERMAEVQLYVLNGALLIMLVAFAIANKALLAIGGGILFAAVLSYLWEMLRAVGHRRKLREWSRQA